jgi:hypothetical protein
MKRKISLQLKIVASLLVFVFILGNLFFFFGKKEARAQIDTGDILQGIGTCIASSVIGSVLGDGFTTGTEDGDGTQEVPTFDDDQDAKQKEGNLKEELVDCLVYTAQTEVLESIVEDVLGWVQTGYGGGEAPQFITDEFSYLSEIRDFLAEDFITNDLQGANIPNSFKDDVIDAVTKDSSRVDFDDIIECEDQNVDFDQLFSEDGGGDYDAASAYIHGILTDPACAPMGSYLLASAEKERKQGATEQREQDRLDRGDGFLPQIDDDGSITTPGINIKAITDRLLESGVKKIEESDEIAEIVTALLEDVVTTVFSTGGSLCDTGFGGGC